MFKNTVYLANNQGENEVKQADTNKQSLTSNTQVKSMPDVSQNQEIEPNTGILLIILIVVLIIVTVLIGLYLNLKSQPDIPVSGLLTRKKKPKEQIEANKEVENTEEIKNKEQEEINQTAVLTDIFSEENSQESKENSDEINKADEEADVYVHEESVVNEISNKETDDSLKLSTPRSIDKCIKSFLEITKIK